MDHSITVSDNKMHSDEFQIKANNESDSENEEESKKNKDVEKEKAPVVDESDAKKLSKYNQLYDRVRKKRDDLECLYIQRQFLGAIEDILTSKEQRRIIATQVLNDVKHKFYINCSDESEVANYD